MILITNALPVALLGGHYIYHVTEVQSIAIDMPNKIENKPEEQRLSFQFNIAVVNVLDI